MSGEWAAVAHRGQLTLDVLSTRRAIEEGYILPDGWTLLGVLHPDGADPQPLAFRDAARVVAWCGEMCPRELRVLGVDDADELMLRRALGAGGRLH